jgi:hypothetical protein
MSSKASGSWLFLLFNLPAKQSSDRVKFWRRLKKFGTIRKFIDSDAKFVFANSPSETPEAIPYDMFEVEFSHHGDRCTFETLIERFGIRDRAVRRLAELIHDADLEDDKFHRLEGFGIEQIFKGLAKFLKRINSASASSFSLSRVNHLPGLIVLLFCPVLAFPKIRYRRDQQGWLAKNWHQPTSLLQLPKKSLNARLCAGWYEPSSSEFEAC